MKKEIINRIIAGSIAAMFVYAAVLKLSDYARSRGEMLNQVFPTSVAVVLTWLVPVIEMVLVLLLLLPATRKKATWAAVALLSVFSIYIFLGMNNFFSRQPCNCAGILGEDASYSAQLYFNLFFISLSLTSIAIENNWIKRVKNNSWFHLKKKNEFTQSSA